MSQIVFVQCSSDAEIVLRYVEQNADATTNEVIFMRYWRDIASSSKFMLRHQAKLVRLYIRENH